MAGQGCVSDASAPNSSLHYWADPPCTSWVGPVSSNQTVGFQGFLAHHALMSCMLLEGLMNRGILLCPTLGGRILVTYHKGWGWALIQIRGLNVGDQPFTEGLACWRKSQPRHWPATLKGLTVAPALLPLCLSVCGCWGGAIRPHRAFSLL